MAAGAPWSVKGIDPKAREVAKELARRSGMTLGEWLNRVILEDDVPEEVASEADLAPRPIRLPEPPRPRLAATSAPAGEDLGRVAQALDRLTDRIEASETRTGLAIAGVEHSVRQAVARIEAAEREQLAVAARVETLAVQVEAGPRPEAAGPRSAEALRALYGDEVEIPPGDALMDQLVARLGERLALAERRTAESIEALRGSLAQLDRRVGSVEGAASADLDSRFEALAEDLGRRVEEARAEAAAQLGQAASGGFDQRLSRMAEHVAAAEARSARAIERMGHEVLTLAEALNKRLQAAEQQSAAVADQVGSDIARMGAVLDGRLARAEQVQAEALRRLGDEIARGAERLGERVLESERRAAQAIEDVGDQVARVTERMEHRHERLTDDLAERLRQSEARAAQLLEEARAALEARLAEAQAKLQAAAPEVGPLAAAAQPEPLPSIALEPAESQIEAESEPEDELELELELELKAEAALPEAAHAPPLYAFPEMLARAEEAPEELEAEAPPVDAADLAEADAFAPIADADEAAFHEPDEAAFDEPDEAAFVGPEEAAPEEEAERQTLSTREVIEQARLAARAAAAAAQVAPPPERRQARSGRRLFRGFGFRSQLRPNSTWQTALMVAGGAAFLSVAAAGVVLMEGPKSSETEAALSPDAGGAQPRAAVALAPQTLGAAAAPEASPAPTPADAYAETVRDLEAGQAGALTRLKEIAQARYAPAEFYLAKLYETGQFGVVKTPSEARKWTQAAAEDGERSAMHNLALYYFRGEGGPQDLAKAAAWFQRAAEAGVVDSQYNLGLLYQTGSGVERNYAEAYKWFAIAAAGGDAQARANAIELRSRLSPAKLAAAQKAASAYRPPSEAAADGASLAEVAGILAGLGYYNGPAAAASAPKLKVAVAAYQRDHGLPATGELDPQTLAKLSVFSR